MISSFSSVARIQKPATAAIVTSTNLLIIGAGTYSLGRSSNFGTSWTYENAPFAVNSNTKICCGNVNAAPLWVIVGNNGGSMTSAISTNGNTWTTSTNINSTIPGTNSAYISCLAFGNGVFMASGYNSGLSAGTPVAISSDGVTWVNGGNIFGSGKLTNAVGYGNGYWVAVANNGGGKTNNLRYSTNVSVAGNTSISWANFVGIPTDPLYSVIYTGTRWIIGGLASNTYYSSSNVPNSTYTVKLLNISNISFHHGATLAVGNNNLIVCGTWVPSGNESATIQYLDGSSMSNTWENISLFTATCTRVHQVDFGGTSTFIAVSNKVNTPVAISTNNGTAWGYLDSVNTNMSTGCYGVAFAK